jgi:putative DNA primase/helicase
MKPPPLTEAEILRYCEARALKLHKSGQELRGPCPIHKGKRDSFAVNAETGQFFCHSECKRGGSLFDLEAALTGRNGREARDAVYQLAGRPLPRIVKTYDYVDERGNVLHQTVRYEPKNFKQRRPDPDRHGEWIWNLQGVRRVLYRLPEVLAAPIVLIVEGEKDADAAAGMGFAATCNPMGAGKWRDEYSETLRDKTVIIIPDNDEAGREHAGKVTRSLQGVALSVKILTLPVGKDLYDWISKGGTQEELTALIEAASEPPSNAGNAPADAPPPCREKAASGDEWLDPPDPEPLDALPGVEQFDEELLPALLRPMVLDIAERMQLPVDLPAVAAVAVLGGATSRRALIQPKDQDPTWIVVPNLWATLIAPPGIGKSPLLNVCMRPLLNIEEQWRNEHEAAAKEYADDEREHKLSMRAWEQDYIKWKKSKKGNMPRPDKPEDLPDAPVRKRLLTNDATYEKLHEIMGQNPAGLMLVRDELTGWLSRLDREEYGAERAFALSAWNGDTPHTVDNIGRGSVHVPHCCLSVLGGITPDRLRSYLAQAPHNSPIADGLMQRFQLAVWPDIPTDWVNVNRLPNAAALQRATEVYGKINPLSHESPKLYRFAPDAQELFFAYLTDLEQTIRANTLPPAIQSHLGKYRSLMPTLALLFELADAAASGCETETVSLVHTQQAADWTEYLRSHMERIYSVEATPEFQRRPCLPKKSATTKPTRAACWRSGQCTDATGRGCRSRKRSKPRATCWWTPGGSARSASRPEGVRLIAIRSTRRCGYERPTVAQLDRDGSNNSRFF